MKQPLPKLMIDEEAETFIDNADLTAYDLSTLSTTRFEFQNKDKKVTMRMPAALFAAIKHEAESSGIPYQRFIRRTLEAAVQSHRI